MQIVDIPTVGGGWFKPAEVKDAVAFLIEVHEYEDQRPTPNGPKDSALCDVSVFPTMAAVDAGTPEVTKGQRIEQTLLARDLKRVLGNGTIVRLEQVPPKRPGQHPAWVWRPVSDPAVRDKILAYVNARQAAIEAAVSAAPDFD
ncbi:hypothetical protein [Streptomyces sp. NPDC019507]|uniref:hypothetical protein n=1 Tax=Streptomyces sp. NPDC019507 TaxID=3154689 RepID=UPI0033D8FD61